jgi:hypothetical protein
VSALFPSLSQLHQHAYAQLLLTQMLWGSSSVSPTIHPNFSCTVRSTRSYSQLLRCTLYGRGGQLFSSAGHIAPLLVSREPHFSQKGTVKAKKISLRGPDVARGPYVAPSCSTAYAVRKYDQPKSTGAKLFIER